VTAALAGAASMITIATATAPIARIDMGAQ
jgi:hypothetical protein